MKLVLLFIFMALAPSCGKEVINFVKASELPADCPLKEDKICEMTCLQDQFDNLFCDGHCKKDY